MDDLSSKGASQQSHVSHGISSGASVDSVDSVDSISPSRVSFFSFFSFFSFSGYARVEFLSGGSATIAVSFSLSKTCLMASIASSSESEVSATLPKAQLLRFDIDLMSTVGPKGQCISCRKCRIRIWHHVMLFYIKYISVSLHMICIDL